MYALAGGGLCLALVASAIYIVGADRELARTDNPPKRYEKVLAEGVTVNRHGVYGVDFLRVGSARIEKVRRGPITLGAFNTLVLDDLEIVMPLDGVPGLEKPPAPAGGESTRTIAASDGVFRLEPATLNFLNPDGTSFSSVSIKGLKVSRQTANGVEPLFSAANRASPKNG